MDSEKRLIVAIALSVLILVSFAYLNPRKTPPPPPDATPVEQAPAAAEQEPSAQPPGGAETSPEEEDAPPPGAAISGAAEERVEIDNGLFRVELTNRGGRVQSWTLLHYTADDNEPLEVFPQFAEEDTERPLGLDLDDASLAEVLNHSVYRVEREELPGDETSASGERVRFTWSDGRGLSAEKVFEFRRGDWFVQVRSDVFDRGRRLPVRLRLGPGFAAQESAEGHSNYYYANQAVWNVGGQVKRTKARKLGPEGSVTGPVLWAGLEDQYFAGLILPNGSPSIVRWSEVTRTPTVPAGAAPASPPQAETVPVLSVSIDAEGADVFVGPKEYRLLVQIGSNRDLDQVVWFSSQGWLRAIVKYLFLGLVWLHDHVARNWGLAIVLATVVLRLVLFPINQYSMVSMKRTQLQMQKLQPKIKAIRARYKKAKDAQSRGKMNEELMELYRKEGVNPMGGMSGCLPLLAQFPILIGFYNMLTVAVELRGAPFVGWIHDLSKEDPAYVLPILMAVTMFAQQWLAMSKIKDPQQLQQQRMMLFMPIVFGFICLQMPSGLVLYWFVNNLLGMGQQWLVNRHAGRLEAAAQKA